MAFLTKLQVKQILDKAPPNLDKGKIVESLISQGNQLEGFDQIQPTSVTPQEGFLKRTLKGVVRAVAEPILRVGATADALGTSKAFGGKGADFTTKQTSVGPIKPISSAKDAAGVALELGATGVGFGGAGTVGKFGARFLKSAALGGVFGTGQTLQKDQSSFKDVLTGAAVGGAIPVAGGALTLAKRFLGTVAKGAASSISGIGSDAIQAVVENPQAAKVGLRGDATKVLTDLANQVRGKVSGLAKEAEDAYGQALEELPKRLGRTPEVLQSGQKTTIRVGGNTYTLSMQGVKSNLTSQLRRFGVVINPKKAEFDFLEAPFIGSEETTLRKVFEVVNSWRDTSPKGLNDLAIKVGQYRKSGTQSPELNAVIDAVKKGVREYAGKRVPAVAELNLRYNRVKDFISAIDQELATNGAFKGGTAENIQTAKRIATIFNKNKELARELVGRLESGEDILATEAGRELSAGVSRSAASIGDSARTVIQSVIPPKAIGEIAIQTGIAQEQLAPILQNLKQLNPAARTLLLRLLSHALIPDASQSKVSEGGPETLLQK